MKKKVLAIVMAAILAIALGVNGIGTVYADYNADDIPQDWANYVSVTGEVTGIEELTDGYGMTFGYRIRLAVGESHVDFNTTANTLLIGEFPGVGDTMTGFFNANHPMIMIYPPQYSAVVIVNNYDTSVFVDRFYYVDTEGEEREMLSADGLRRLNVSNPETVKESQGGQIVDETWDLNGRLLVVLYDVASRSLPPLIFAPTMIIVMYETAVHPGPELIDWDLIGWEDIDWEDIDWDEIIDLGDDDFFGITPPIGDISDWNLWEEDTSEPIAIYEPLPIAETSYPIVVNGVGLPGVDFHVDPNCDLGWPTHAPLRQVLEQLDPDATLLWNRAAQQVTIYAPYSTITLQIGSPVVHINNWEPLLLDTAPILVDGRTHVPLQFFRAVMGMNNAYFSAGTISINNFEAMQ